MRNVRGPNPGDFPRNRLGSARSEYATGAGNRALRPSTSSGPLTLVEEAELGQMFGEYGEFLDSICSPKRASFDPCRAVIPLREALKTANLLVECLRRSKAPADSSVRKALEEQVLDCEEKAADLIGRLSRLRRDLKRGEAAD